MRRWPSPSEDDIQLVAVDREDIVVAGRPAREVDLGPAAYEVRACYVDPDRWRTGVGRRLLAALIDRLDSGRQWRVNTHTTTTPAPMRSVSPARIDQITDPFPAPVTDDQHVSAEQFEPPNGAVFGPGNRYPLRPVARQRRCQDLNISSGNVTARQPRAP